jgi:ACS family tartrate transporter-like MFS transporter
MQTDIERSAMRKLTLRIGLFCGLLYFFNWLDRNNVGFAALQMNKELSFGPAVYGIGAGMFFAGFAIFEVPSNMAMHKLGARVWIARIMITWGLICIACAAIQNIPAFYGLRFILGVAEAGFTPGLLLYFGYWFPRKYRARAFGLLFATPLLAPIVGGPISGWLMTAMHGLGGLSGWRWMFLVEGLPTVVVGLFCLTYLKASPSEAGWLTQPEKDWLVGTLAAEEAAAPAKQHASVSAFLADRRLWALVAVYFFWSLSSYGIVFWLPQIISAATGLNPFQVSLINAVPFIFAMFGLILIGRRSDRTGSRKTPIIVFAIGSGVALIAAGSVASPTLGFVLICLAAFCIWGQQAVFWTLPSTYLTGASAAAGLALVNTGAAVGGFISPPAIGFLKQAGGSYSTAMAGLGVTSLVVAAIVALMRIDRTAGSAAILEPAATS